MAWSTRCKLAVVVAASLVALAIVLIVVLTMNNGGAADSDQPWQKESRLPTTVLPSRYDILLHPFLDEGTFTGTVNIDIQLLEDRKYFVIHAKNLAITSTELQDTSGAKITLNAPFEVPKHEWWVIQPAKGVIPQSSYVLKMEFSGQLTRNIVGFYRSSYNTSNGERRYLATSKFEPTYARLAFPCFDEPAMKASYKVRLVKPSAPEYIALSNSEQKSVVDGPGPNLQTVEFSETVKMSSYLSVFIVCDFVKQSEPNSTMKSNKPVNVYARREQIENAEEARSVALTTVDFYAEYFDIPYPMPKIDLIAIPDFVSGAMENWGLITFRETSILFDKNQNSPANQEAISETVAHELAHMWFGNLVTMKWWTDLWLNEGFATFMAQKGVGHMHPDWDYTNQFVVDTLLSVLKLDAELSSHPVLQVVSNPDQITEIFDTISYDKGSSVILMLEAFMGEENFKKGLNTYLNTHLYNNAETKDLWRALQDFAPLGVDVAKVMDTWTRQMGFPLVTVENTAPGKFKLTQKRFLSSRDAKFDPSESKYGYKWEIPIRFATSASKNNDLVWLPSEQESVSISVDSSIKWIKLNHNQRGYYRVNYNSVGWTELITTLKADIEEIDAVDRAGLISDVFSLADAEELEYDTALELSTYLSKERKYVPWDAASTAINSLLKRLPKSEALKKYGISLVTPIVDELSWTVTNRSDHLERRLRALVLDLACSLEDNAALSQANNLFTSWLTGGDGNKPDQDIRSVVYRYGFGNSNDSALWKQVFEKFQAETNTQEKLKLMYSLATTRNEDDLKTYLKYSKDQNVIRSQDFFTVLAYIADNPLGVQLVWDFYRDEYDYLVERFTLNDRIFGRFITRIAAKFDTEERLKEIKAFFDKHPDAGAGAAARKQALENVQNSIKWLTKHKGTVESWLQKAA